MKKILFLLLLAFGMTYCSSSDDIDLDPNDPNEHLDDEDDEDDEDDDDEEGDKDDEDDKDKEDEEVNFDEGKAAVEVLYFSDLILLPEYQGLTTTDQIELAIDQISEGGIIEFEATNYNITTDLDIYKGVTLRGVGETPTPSDNYTSAKEVAGSGVIETTFTLTEFINFNVRADNVKFQNMEIVGYYATTTTAASVEFFGSIRNFQTENVYFNGGRYMLSPRAGMTHGLKCKYTTFFESKNRAFFINRYDESVSGMEVTILEKCEFYRCAFSVLDPSVSDTRAISLDAGNNENPNIMDFDGFEIRECYFDNIGFASSKCKNINIIDCEFYLNDLFDFPLHMEEYSQDFYIAGNTFDCDDFQYNGTYKHMMGVLDNSIVENNIVKGTCGGFVQGHYAEGMIIRNNDCSQMTPKLTLISMWNGFAGSRDITITGNTFPSGSTISISATSEYQSSIVVSGNSGSTGGYSSCSGYTYPLADGAKCRIRHNETGQYLKARGSNSTVTLATTPDDACTWTVYRVWPNRYNVVCEMYNTYLYIEKDPEGYSDAASALAANIVPETKQYNSAIERVPIWDFTAQLNGKNIVGPGGGNDGCLGIGASSGGELKCYKDNNRSMMSSTNVTDTECLWSFELVN